MMQLTSVCVCFPETLHVSLGCALISDACHNVVQVSLILSCFSFRFSPHTCRHYLTFRRQREVSTNFNYESHSV